MVIYWWGPHGGAVVGTVSSQQEGCRFDLWVWAPSGVGVGLDIDLCWFGLSVNCFVFFIAFLTTLSFPWIFPHNEFKCSEAFSKTAGPHAAGCRLLAVLKNSHGPNNLSTSCPVFLREHSPFSISLFPCWGAWPCTVCPVSLFWCYQWLQGTDESSYFPFSHFQSQISRPLSWP